MRKKLLAIALCAVMAFGLVACGGDDTSASTGAVTDAQYQELKEMLPEYSALVDQVNELAAMVELDDSSAGYVQSINNDIEYLTEYVANPEVLEGTDVDETIALLKQDMGGAESILAQLKAALGIE